MNSQLFFLHSVLIPLLKAAKMGLIELFFADGVHLIYGYHGGYCWCKERQCVPSAYGRERVNLLGFMNAITFETKKKMNGNYSVHMPTIYCIAIHFLSKYSSCRTNEFDDI